MGRAPSPHVVTTRETVAAGDTGAASPNFVLAREMTPNSDTLVVRMLEAAYAGDAQYRVLVDGMQVGGAQIAGAAHASGASRDHTPWWSDS